jgi:demethylspheroidene O-methyltransferase
VIGFKQFLFSKIRDRILLNDRLRSFIENSIIFKPFVRAQANEIFDLVSGFVYSQILFACVSLDLFEKLRNAPISLKELSKSCEIDLLEMQRLVDGASALGLLEKREGETIGLGYRGVVILTKPSISALVKHHSTLYEDLIDPVKILQRKKKSTSLGSFWPYALDTQDDTSHFSHELAKNYSDVMSISQPLVSEQICSTYNFHKHKKILDLGGGQATFLINLAKNYSRSKMTVFDLPQVSKMAEKKILESGFQNRIDVHEGSFLKDPIPTGYDLITLIRVLYDHSDENVRKILSSVKKSLPTAGTLLIAEPMSGHPGTEKMSDAYFGMYLLAMGKGAPRSHKKIFHLLKEAGFSSIQSLKVTLPIQTGLIIAKT